MDCVCKMRTEDAKFGAVYVRVCVRTWSRNFESGSLAPTCTLAPQKERLLYLIYVKCKST